MTKQKIVFNLNVCNYILQSFHATGPMSSLVFVLAEGGLGVCVSMSSLVPTSGCLGVCVMMHSLVLAVDGVVEVFVCRSSLVFMLAEDSICCVGVCVFSGPYVGRRSLQSRHLYLCLLGVMLFACLFNDIFVSPRVGWVKYCEHAWDDIFTGAGVGWVWYFLHVYLMISVLVTVLAECDAVWICVVMS